MFKTAQVLVVLLLASATALAGLATDPLAYNDGFMKWHGSTPFYSVSGTDPSKVLSATVEWAVYAPGAFNATGYTGYTPTLGEFVYAYQIECTGTVEVKTMWVNMLDSNEANNIGDFSMSGVVPTSAFFGDDPPNRVSANWEFLSPLLVTPGVSEGLVYSSINAPTIFDGAIQDGGLVAPAIMPLPSPSDVIPEPVTVLVLAAGALLAGLRRRT